MLTDILILGAVALYCGFVIRRYRKNRKDPEVGCKGCSGCGGSCPGGNGNRHCDLKNTGK